MRASGRRAGLVAIGLALGGALVLVIDAALPGSSRETATSAPSPTPSIAYRLPQRVGGVLLTRPVVTIPPGLQPYPYTTPMPPNAPTVLDGAYVRIVTLPEVGGARVGLPVRCFRCIPFHIDAGVSTLFLYRGAYYIDHQLSGFRSFGSFIVSKHRVTFFNDANCPSTRGQYTWERHGSQLTFRVVRDPCQFSGERAYDLTFKSWTRFEYCVVRFQGLWPGEVGCP
jgi:hypothetical protein